MRKTTFALVAAFAISMTMNGGARADENKIGFIDMQKAIQSVETGKKAKSDLEKQIAAKKAELQKEDESIKKAAEEFKKQSLVMNDEARNKKAGELNERNMRFQEKVARSQGELQQKEQELTQPIVDGLKTVTAEVAKSKGYGTVLVKNDAFVVYSQEKDDLTNDVIAAFNKKKK
jgi:outer membrane protein